ncbi:preprotein translocase subunit SecG [Ferrimonas balearica]|uniref:preprotein translocase subunit SecG n=1 Tax=Ferrimonas balearica TaxID=44012 RepID=UPI001C59E305|nr:preprotein translocase subunit SecG [Ferrimonas balearica]MBY6017573.1 preprotein translocase subunit SecG [Halomonas denitrificans]MBW3139926.1 preprotein translocase subunit SecG [Ferrimonas balearica]MBW3164950.1 preprotein translocase subunit SecG [Ferrimonas balearica]MBY5980182.1 preprotein translocase subunit SecG [Ferrimonas balearica]MBY6093912.1 preprotein translocase subunit SecG [Ferrimonas balearica]
MFEILMVVYLLVALGIIGLVLIQQGQGASMGASFGAGASATLFGSSGSGNFLTRATAVLATAFFVLSLVLGRMSAHSAKPTEGWDEINVPVVEQPAETQPSGDVPN